MLNDNHIEPKQADTLPCGFPAGTRVTTDKGLKRIEEIAVGDLVLSKAENGEGKQVFKPVKRVSVHNDVEIYELNYMIVPNTIEEKSLSGKAILYGSRSKKGGIFSIKATKNQLFKVNGSNWIKLADLKKGQLLEMKDTENLAYVVLICPEYQTTNPNIMASLGFTSVAKLDQFDDDKKYQYSFQTYSENGDCNLLLDGRSSRSPVEIENFGEVYVIDKARLSSIYHLEIADNHTCYIFDKIWVHE